MVASLILASAALRPDIRTDIVYKQAGDKQLKLDLYMPDSPIAEPVPLVVVFHGGAWVSGKKEDMANLCKGIAAQGMAAATVQYRLAPGSKWPAMIDDSRDSVKFMRDHAADYGVSSEKVATCGGSAGGHLAMLVAFGPMEKPVTSVFNIFGPTDLSNDFDPNLKDMVCKMVLGKPASESEAEIASLSPITYVTTKSPPVFTLHGTSDMTVPVKQANRLQDALKAAMVEHETVIVEGMGHGVDMNVKAQADGIAAGIAFLKRQFLK